MLLSLYVSVNTQEHIVTQTETRPVLGLPGLEGAYLTDEPWMTIAEAQAYLRVSRATIYRLMRENRLKYFTVGDSTDRRFRKADLDAALLPGSPEEGKGLAA